jgi:Tol biopolymer transport system component
MGLRRGATALVLGALLSACGSRTGLEPFSSQVDGGESRDATPDVDGSDAPDAPDAPEADVRDARDVTVEPDASCGAPWVLFTLIDNMVDAGTQTIHVYARRADGTGGHILPLPGSEAEHPSVSPDGTELLYSNNSIGQLFLYRFSDGSNQSLATAGGTFPGAVSPDGRAVVYSDEINLWLVGTGADAGAERSLLKPGHQAAYPVFTKDSSTVVFSAPYVVQSIAVDGSHLETLLTQSAMSPFVTLSPDYTELAAIVQCSDRPYHSPYELRVYDFASLPAACESGRIVTTVSISPEYLTPSWGPTGLIAYSDGQDIFTVSSGGGTPADLTADLTAPLSAASDPTWAPSCAQIP